MYCAGEGYRRGGGGVLGMEGRAPSMSAIFYQIFINSLISFFDRFAPIPTRSHGPTTSNAAPMQAYRSPLHIPARINIEQVHSIFGFEGQPSITHSFLCFPLPTMTTIATTSPHWFPPPTLQVFPTSNQYQAGALNI